MISFDAAACRDSDPALFLPAQNDPHAINVARKICAHCPIRIDCLALALTNSDAEGIWGGLTQTERASHRSHETERSVSAA